VDGFDLGPWLDLLRSGPWVTVYATVLGTLLATGVAFALGLLSLTPGCTEGNDYFADLFTMTRRSHAHTLVRHRRCARR
jgi:hypothetical protein